jgi:oligo-1,6-glucosidase/alpha-glucosidase
LEKLTIKNIPWWQKTTIYQIYPRSFWDTNGDGIGDLQGILSKLDYVKDLGFETIWFSPFYCSPQRDFGYDVSDYYNIDPEYGTMAEAEALIEEVHKRGMRVLFDLVLNHTSDQHPWFRESRSSRESPKREWYIWRDGQGRNPPNNWVAIPGGPAWHFDAQTGQYYYASFLPFQPDLNWRNPEVKQAMFDVARFWLDKGVDGFRLDIFHSIFKDSYLRNNPFSFRYIPKEDRAGFFQRWKYSIKQPEVYKLAVELRELLDSYDGERMLIGEVFGNVAEEKRFLGEKLDGLNLIFLWKLLHAKLSAGYLRKVIAHYERHYPSPYVPVYVFGNHDRKRLLSRIAGNLKIARLLALFQFTVRGVPVTYYGEEIGMLDGNFAAGAMFDPIGERYHAIPGFILDLLDLYVNRDGCRTPMQWEDSLNAGFCPAEISPWLPVNDQYHWANVASEKVEGDSLLNTYRRVLKLRREEELLQTGELQLIEGPDIDQRLVVYKRKNGNGGLLVVLNFSRQTVVFQNKTRYLRSLLAVGMREPLETKQLSLDPFSGVVLKK